MILLVLNTMYWNNKRNTDPIVVQTAENQMQWLNNQLQLAKDQGKNVLIMSHIPAGWVIHLLSLVNAVSPGLSKFQAQRKFVQRMESFRNRG